MTWTRRGNGSSSTTMTGRRSGPADRGDVSRLVRFGGRSVPSRPDLFRAAAFMGAYLRPFGWPSGRGAIDESRALADAEGAQHPRMHVVGGDEDSHIHGLAIAEMPAEAFKCRIR